AVIGSAAVRDAPGARKREQRRAADEVLHEAVERRVAGKLGHELVKADRQALPRLAVAAVVGALFLGDEGAQLGDLLRRYVAREALHQRRLDDTPRLEKIGRLRGRRVGDDGAAVRAQLDEQAVAEPRERAAHRAAARAEDLGELALLELRAGREPMVEHRVEDGVEDAVFGAGVALLGMGHVRRGYASRARIVNNPPTSG